MKAQNFLLSFNDTFSKICYSIMRFSRKCIFNGAQIRAQLMDPYTHIHTHTHTKKRKEKSYSI